MSRPIKIALWSVAALSGLLLTAGLAAPFLISSERYLPILEEKAGAALGMPVEIRSLRLRPGLGIRLEADGIRVGPEQGSPPLEVDKLRIGVRLLPLLRGEVRVSLIGADGVRVRLRRRSDGAWGPVGAPGGGPASAGEAPARGTPSAALPVDRIELSRVFATFIDSRGAAWLRKGWTVGPARLELAPAPGSAPWRFALGLALEEQGGEILTASGAVAPADLSTAAARLAVRGLEFAAVSRLLALAGVSLPSGLGSGTLDGVLELAGGAARLSPLTIRLGREEIEGDLEWRREGSELNGKLRSRSLNLDTILAALATPPAPAGPPAASTPAARTAGAPGAAPPLRGALTVEVERGRLLGLEFGEARVESSLENGRLALRTLKLSLYDGGLEGSGSLGLGKEPLPYSLRGRAKEIDLEGALPALWPDLKGVVSGRFTGALDLEGAGLSGAAIMENLKGPLQLDLRDGRITSLGVLRQVAELLEVAGGKGIGHEFTPYRSITGDFRVEKGRARTRNLALRSDDLDLDGEGSVGLDTTLDFAVDGRFSKPVTESLVAKTGSLRHLVEKDGRLRLRLLMRGALATPRVEIDQAFLRKALKRAAEERGREKLRDRLQDLLR